ncbi:arginine--tRNA ligase [Candidatus Riesia pediculischaeffi]|uniref:Arginine--tRNA ligase n=1 Tax=Candidatus Riesia pediculischaeffi PTSU TaxID=1401651 RepID=A0A0C1RZP5_9ENTR|nr:arginine--tRNA ligase [Candidatus Riesia pediculischaeffi]KIE63762.1 Arginyl-tRNA synthetase [Candidatus Riesia pediculischaeffi PTSU]
MNIKQIIQEKIRSIVTFENFCDSVEVRVRFSKNRKTFGDYQIEGLSNILKSNRISLETFKRKLCYLFSKEEYIKSIKIIEPNFINIFLHERWISRQIDTIFSKDRLGISQDNYQKKIVTIIDYSSPNMAKNMHVGHLRSTIIGDTVVRVSKFLGKKVIKANHIGDWGTQFGMIIAYLKEILRKNCVKNITLEKIEDIYQRSRKIFDQNGRFSHISRRYIQQLQSGDDELLTLWNDLVQITILENQRIYDLLGVSLNKGDIVAESFYKDMLQDIVEDLKQKKIAVIHNGAVVVYLDDFKNHHGRSSAVMIQKSDGGYLYATVEIACLKYRCEKLKADRIIYYVDSRQTRHLQQSWAIARKAGYIKKRVKLEHHQIGMILGEDKKPFRTRSGRNIKLFDLLKESITRARKFIVDKNSEHLNKRSISRTARKIGIGSVKYSDLSKNRKTDYVFDWNNVFSFIGNTSSYIQYTYSRTKSLINRSNISPKELKNDFYLSDRYERELSIQLLRLEEVLQDVSKMGLPNILCCYLYELSNIFSKFYEHCAILHSIDDIQKENRIKLVFLTERTIKIGLNLLGIQTVSKM